MVCAVSAQQEGCEFDFCAWGLSLHLLPFVLLQPPSASQNKCTSRSNTVSKGANSLSFSVALWWNGDLSRLLPASTPRQLGLAAIPWWPWVQESGDRNRMEVGAIPSSRLSLILGKRRQTLSHCADWSYVCCSDYKETLLASLSFEKPCLWKSRIGSANTSRLVNIRCNGMFPIFSNMMLFEISNKRNLFCILIVQCRHTAQCDAQKVIWF